MNTLEVLQAARERIAKGWCQFDYGEVPGANKVCIDGALLIAKGLTDFSASDWPTTTPERRLLADLAGADSIIGWNDEPGRTQAEVLELFDTAIEKVKAEQGLMLDD